VNRFLRFYDWISAYGIPILLGAIGLTLFVGQERRIATWEAARAEILVSRVAERPRPNGKRRYELELRYRFKVAGRDYNGTRSRTNRGERSSDREVIAQAASRFQVHSVHEVRYDPADPSQSALELKRDQLALGLLTIGLLVGLGVWFWRRPSLGEEQRWAILATAPLLLWDDDPLDRLERRASGREVAGQLNQWWDVHDRESAEEKLDWLMSEGHSAGFASRMKGLAGLDEAALAERLAGTSEEEAALDRFIQERGSDARFGRLVAWDVVRLIHLARGAANAGYIEADEAWGWMLRGAARLRNEYSSWRELAAQFQLGYGYWRLGLESSPEADAYDGLEEFLFAPKGGHWADAAWDVVEDAEA